MSSPTLNEQEASCSINPTDLINSLNTCVQSGAILPSELANLISRFVSSPTSNPGCSASSLSISTHLPTPPASRTNSNPSTPSQTSIPAISSPPQSPSKRYVFSDTLEDKPTRIDTKVKATNQNICDKLYHYENGTYLEFPQSSENGIGYLIKCDPDNWHSPLRDIVYAHGDPGSIQKKRIRHRLLGNGEVDCTYEYRTCHGIRICPYVDRDQVSAGHNAASRELLRERLSREYDHWKEGDCPSRELFEKTLAFIQSVQRLGCLLEQDVDPVAYAPTQEQAFLQQHHQTLKCGYTPKKPQCPGRIVFGWDWQGLPAIMCEFYSDTCRLHSCQLIDKAYNVSYIEAVLSGNKEEAIRLEKEASLEYNVGPDAECTWVENISSQRKNCPRIHRDPDTGFLYSPLMEKMKCGVKFHVYTPVKELRHQFPYALMIVRGTHYHPIPLPTKTPPRLRDQILDLLGSMSEELSELTPRRFIRHPIPCAHLKKVFPNNPTATFGDLHPSLSNHSHLASFIKTVKSQVFPKGTGWEGALHLYEIQRNEFPIDAQYIRHIECVSNKDLAGSDSSDDLHLIFCQSKEGSSRLQQTQYGQSDISFKRINGIWMEFIAAGKDKLTKAAVVYSRVYVTQQSAAAHFRIFQTIEKIVQGDTGNPIRWRHLYASSNKEQDQDGCLLMWTGDQDGGQAKGLGMHLQAIAQTRSGYDLYELHRKLSDLDPYEHLHRIFRLCTVHFFRNVKKCVTPSRVKKAMYSLACIEHEDWDGALELIRRDGGRTGIDWLENKVQSQFALESICWQRSKIPLYIWKAGDSHDNLVEASHANVNLEGKAMSLVGGVESGRRFDFNRMGLLQTFESAGVRRLYKTNHLSEAATKAIKRKHKRNHENFNEPDRLITKHNEDFDKAEKRMNTARTRGINLRNSISKLIDELANIESKYERELNPSEKEKLRERLRKKSQKIDEEKDKMNKQASAFKTSGEELQKLSEQAGKLRPGSGKYVPKTLFTDS